MKRVTKRTRVVPLFAPPKRERPRDTCIITLADDVHVIVERFIDSVRLGFQTPHAQFVVYANPRRVLELAEALRIRCERAIEEELPF